MAVGKTVLLALFEGAAQARCSIASAEPPMYGWLGCAGFFVTGVR
jgi:hypothetical protein